MPMPRKPYIVLIRGVKKSGDVDITGMSIKLKNDTKSTDDTKISNELDSNIIMNLSDQGDWAINDVLTVEITYRNQTVSKTHTIVSGDFGKYDFGNFEFAFSKKIMLVSNISKIAGVSNININSIGGKLK